MIASRVGKTAAPAATSATSGTFFISELCGRMAKTASPPAGESGDNTLV